LAASVAGRPPALRLGRLFFRFFRRFFARLLSFGRLAARFSTPLHVGEFLALLRFEDGFELGVELAVDRVEFLAEGIQLGPQLLQFGVDLAPKFGPGTGQRRTRARDVSELAEHRRRRRHGFAGARHPIPGAEPDAKSSRREEGESQRRSHSDES
jgi:hypothetical protein